MIGSIGIMSMGHAERVVPSEGRSICSNGKVELLGNSWLSRLGSMFCSVVSNLFGSMLSFDRQFESAPSVQSKARFEGFTSFSSPDLNSVSVGAARGKVKTSLEPIDDLVDVPFQD